MTKRDQLIDRLIEEDPSITNADALVIFENWRDDVDVLYWLIVMLLYRKTFVGAGFADRIARTADDQQLACVAFLLCIRAEVWVDVADWPENAAINPETRALGLFFASNGADGGIDFTEEAVSRSRIAAAMRWAPPALRVRMLNAALDQTVDEDDRGVRSQLMRTVRDLAG